MRNRYSPSLVALTLIAAVLAAGCGTSSATVPPATAEVTLSATPLVTATSLPAATIVPTPTPEPTEASSPTPTATTLPQVRLRQDVILYSGPGNTGYEALADLSGQAVLSALGTFGDFVEVQAYVGGKPVSGFIWKGAVGDIPAGIPEIEVDSVPWVPVPVLNSFVGGFTVFRGDQIIIQNTTDSFYDPEGTGIDLDSGFKLTVKLQVSGAPFGSLKLLGIPEPTDRPYWQGIRRMDLSFYRGSLGLGFRDGSNEDPKGNIDLPIQANQSLTLVFKDPQGEVFSVLDAAGLRLTTVDVTRLPGLQMPDGLFPERKLYLGASSSPHSTLIISSLSMQLPPTGKWTTTADEPPGLQAIAGQKDITIGTEFSIWNARDARYWNTMTTEYNVAILSEFSCQADFWRGRGDYNFLMLDRAVDFALLQGWRVRASHLVWGTYDLCPPPDWLLRGTFSRDEYIQILQEHVKTVMGHYRGRVVEWSIANEAISRSFCASGCDFWNDRIGPDYIEIAFRAAREADPGSLLIFNDNGNDSPRDANAARIINRMYDTVKTLKGKGVPIDVVGMQMHFLTSWDSGIPRKDDVIETMRKFADLGVAIFITEFDVDLTRVSGSRPQRWARQAELYHDMMAACVESGVCRSFSTWGVSDATSWLTCAGDWCAKEPDADPLMFDKECQPKPAYYAVRDALLGK